MKMRPDIQGRIAVILVFVLLLCSAATIVPTSALAKARTEVQLGDPTDTDPGPAPGPPKGNKGLSFNLHGSAGIPASPSRLSLVLKTLDYVALCTIFGYRGLR